MPRTNTMNNSDTDNTESEATNLDRAGAGDVGGAAGQREQRQGSPEDEARWAGATSTAVDSERHDPTYTDALGADQLGNETGLNGDTPVAGDVDPDSTRSAEETGQDGDPTRPGKSHGKPWNE